MKKRRSMEELARVLGIARPVECTSRHGQTQARYYYTPGEAERLARVVEAARKVHGGGAAELLDLVNAVDALDEAIASEREWQ